MEAIELLRARIQQLIPKPTELHSEFSITGCKNLEWEQRLLTMPEAELEHRDFSFALEDLPFDESLHFLPAALEYCIAEDRAYSGLVSGHVLIKCDSHCVRFLKLGLYELCLEAVEALFVHWTSSFANDEREPAYWGKGEERRLLSPAKGWGSRNNFLWRLCARDLILHGQWFSTYLFARWAKDDQPHRRAHLIDFLYAALTTTFPFSLECFHEPYVVCLLMDEQFCRRSWDLCGELFRSVTGDEYSDAVQSALLDERAEWLGYADQIELRDTPPRGLFHYFVVKEATAMETHDTEYDRVRRQRREVYHRWDQLISRAQTVSRLLHDRRWRGRRAAGISDRFASPPMFPEGPALFDVADWPSAQEVKQAFDELNAANAAVIAAWDALSDEEKAKLPIPSEV